MATERFISEGTFILSGSEWIDIGSVQIGATLDIAQCGDCGTTVLTFHERSATCNHCSATYDYMEVTEGYQEAAECVASEDFHLIGGNLGTCQDYEEHYGSRCPCRLEWQAVERSRVLIEMERFGSSVSSS